MLATLDRLAALPFDVLFANTDAANPVCCVETKRNAQAAFIEELRAGLG